MSVTCIDRWHDIYARIGCVDNSPCFHFDIDLNANRYIHAATRH